MRETLSKGATMLMARYLVLLLVWHLSSFFHQWPWSYLWGIVTWPAYFVLCMLPSAEGKKAIIARGVSNVLEQVQNGELPGIPRWVRVRLWTIWQEAVCE